MSLSMYEASVPVLIRALENLNGVLEKGQAHAAAKGTDEANYVTMRLVPDMLPLSAQVKIACDIARRGASRLAGIEPESADFPEASFDDLKSRVTATVAFLKTLKPESFEGSETREILLPTPMGELKFSGKDFLFGFALANVHFHSTMAYALLRSAGVDLGKKDYLGA